MSFFDRLFGKKGKTGDSAPKFLKKQQNGDATYEVYQAGDAESAKAFLAAKKVDKPQYYIIVETPEGNWGVDVKGLYLERLLSWQTNLASAQCEGSTAGIPDTFSLTMAAQGINDNFIVPVRCGQCGHIWTDGLRYRGQTVVRCPNCRTLNKVDSTNIKVVLI
jgi:phage FluMu protein Com